MARPARHQDSGGCGCSARRRALITAHLPSLLGAALAYRGSHDQAESLVRATLWDAAAQVPDEEDPLSLLHALLWHRHLASEAATAPPEAAPTTMPGSADGAPATLVDAVAALPAPARAAIHLVDVAGLSYVQLARVLGTEVEAAARLLHATRRQLAATGLHHHPAHAGADRDQASTAGCSDAASG